MKPVTIFGFAGSTFTRTARMVCLEKAIAHTLAPLEFGADSHRALHPFLKMPAMEHDGVRLYETLAIATYLDAVGPGPSLRPTRDLDLARMMQWISAAIDYLYPDLVSSQLDAPPASGDARIAADLELLDRGLRDTAFLAGESLSIADLFVAPMIDFATRKTGIELAPRAGLARWWRVVSERPSFRETAS